ncbi:MAG: hemolysin family protein [Pseudomonadota bacterium]
MSDPAGTPSKHPINDNRAPARADAGKRGFFSRIAGVFRPAAKDAVEAALTDGDGPEGRPLSPARREMIERVIAFDEKKVVDVMAPRADIYAVDMEMSLDELIREFADAGHSRMPIYREDLDNPVGMVHIKDVVGLLANAGDATNEPRPKGDGPILKKISREILYAPPSMRVTDLLLRMQASRIHMALVIDEYGGTDGLVTIEDLIEEIVGEINDEHDDDDAALINAHADGGWTADARVEIDEFAEETGIDLHTDDEEIDTLGGLVFTLAGRVPQRGEVIAGLNGFDFEVTEADPRKVRKICIMPSEKRDDAGPRAGGAKRRGPAGLNEAAE